MTALATQRAEVLKANLPAIPPKDAMCHRGICSQSACSYCSRIIRAHAVVDQMLGRRRWAERHPLPAALLCMLGALALGTVIAWLLVLEGIV